MLWLQGRVQRECERDRGRKRLKGKVTKRDREEGERRERRKRLTLLFLSDFLIFLVIALLVINLSQRRFCLRKIQVRREQTREKRKK
jgi:hypothetical protein